MADRRTGEPRGKKGPRERERAKTSQSSSIGGWWCPPPSVPSPVVPEIRALARGTRAHRHSQESSLTLSSLLPRSATLRLFCPPPHSGAWRCFARVSSSACTWLCSVRVLEPEEEEQWCSSTCGEGGGGGSEARRQPSTTPRLFLLLLFPRMYKEEKTTVNIFNRKLREEEASLSVVLKKKEGKGEKCVVSRRRFPLLSLILFSVLSRAKKRNILCKRVPLLHRDFLWRPQLIIWKGREKRTLRQTKRR